MRGGTAVLLLAAVVLGLAPGAGAAPEQVHVGIVGTEGGRPVFAVNWLDGVPDNTEDQRVDGPSLGFVYERRLDPGATSYRLDAEARALRPPPPTLPSEGFRFVALGDMGITPQAHATADVVGGLDPDLVLHAGDLSYAQGDPVAWKEWFLMIQPVASVRPWMTALGNHETYTGPLYMPWVVAGVPSPVETAFYQQRFALPGNELWYSFDWAGVHFVALDTFSASGGTDAGPLPEGEVAWLEQDLAAHEGAPWTIVWLHQPPYSSGEHGDSARVQEAFVPLFEAYGVDLVIGGHDHTYERSYPLRGGQPAQAHPNAYRAGDGVVYVVTGGAGRSLYELAPEAPAWSAARNSSYHVVEVAVTSTEIRGRYVPTAGDAFEDAWSITKGDALTAGPGDPLPAAIPGPETAALVGALAGVAALGRRGPRT